MGLGVHNSMYNDNVEITPTSDYFWIDNNRFHKDSLIDCSPIYNDNLEIEGSWIRVTHKDMIIHIECIDTKDYKWKEFRDSFIMAFKEKTL